MNKKAMHSHLFVIILVTIFMTGFILSIGGTIFKPDHPDCILYEYEIENRCKEGSGVSFNVVNKGNKRLDFTLNDESRDNFKVISGESEKFIYSPRTGSNVVLTPHIEDFRGENSQCKGKRTTINLERLIKC